MTEEKKRALWACARCERRKKIANVQPDPVVLRTCDYCNIQNWVRPVGHAGADAGSGPIMEQRVTDQGERLPLYRGKEVKEALQEEEVHAETVVEEVSEPTEEEAAAESPEEVEEAAVAEAVAEANQAAIDAVAAEDREKEIARLKAELAELEEKE